MATDTGNGAAGSTAGDFRPLAEVRRDFRVKWYRSPVEPALLRELMRRSDWRGGLHSVGHLLLWAATGALVWLLFAAELWPLFALALMAHGVVGSFFKGAAIHELGHGTVFRTKWLNELFTRVFCLFGFVNIYDFKVSHSYHHRYTLHPEGDREVVLPQDPTYRFLYLLQLFTVNITGGYQSAGLWPVLRLHVITAAGRYPDATGAGGDWDGEWMRAIYRDAPAMRRKAVWAARFILLYLAGTIIAADCAGRADPGPAADCSPGRRALAALAGGRADACRPARQRARLPPVRAQQHPRPDLGVPVLEHELAHRASHVRRRAMLQPRQAVPGDPRRRARTAHPAGIMARDPGHLEAATAGIPATSTTRPCPRPRTRRCGRRPTCRGVPRRRAAGTRRSTQPATRSPR